MEDEDAERAFFEEMEANPYWQAVAELERRRREGLEHIDEATAHSVGDAPPNDSSEYSSWKMFVGENWWDYANGNRAAIVIALLQCARSGQPIPKPIADEFDRLIERLVTGDARCWEDIFGPAREPGRRKVNIRSNRALRWHFYHYAQALRFGCTVSEYQRWDGSIERFRDNVLPPKTPSAKAVDEEFFEILGEAFSMSSGRARKFYYATLHYFRFEGRSDGPRMPTGIDNTFGL